MPRLIDAEPVLSYIDRLQNSGLGKGKTLEYIAKFLENQPTAYDVKSVVEQLEVNSGIHIILKETAIEIVESGGSDE